ncbi:respiratory burst oxidase homolog protein F-like [Tasmannia lanceolata]|uniref:respiratory burst oxidase homolog protein F-like n=1 Tax=Tasmannia lanceolata TaxID=3420 RepID=UPI004062884A
MENKFHCPETLQPSSSPSSSYVDSAKVVPLICGNEPASIAGRSIQRLRFIDQLTNGRMEWKEVEERFDRLASTEPGRVPVVSRLDFASCIGMKETPEFVEELLGALEGRSDRRSEITKPELHDYWRRIIDPNFSSRIRIFFDLCDRNMDGKITEMEIKQVILLSASANKLSMKQEEVEQHAALVMEELDWENRGYIELSQLETLLKECSSKDPISMSRIPATGATNSGIPRRATKSSVEILIRTQWRRAWIIAFWLITCFLLFTWKFMQYRRRSAFEVMGFCLCTAKGAAETLKFNMALILLPVCRNTVTWLRTNRRINSVIPFNDNINFHKLIAGGIVIGVILHGGTHLACDFPRIAGANHSIFRRTIAGDFRHRQPSYVEILATTEAVTGITMAILMAIAFSLATQLPRRRPKSLPWPFRRITGFNAFWYSHHLFVIVYILLIIHSMFLFLTKDATEKTTWMYIAIPILLYTGERIVRAIRAGFYDVKILEAAVYPGKVLSLKLRKPVGFRYRSGMYIFIQCPQISSFEWHPFSLTSAPDDDHTSVHIRTLGDWTYQIYSLFQEVLVARRSDFPKIYIDGPYGTASQDHVKYEIVVLIGLGIGATPFISVLKDIVYGTQKPRPDAIDGGESGVRKGPSKAYFYWVTREQSSFDWFRDVMKEISETNHRKQAVVEMHNYLTSVYQDGDARSALIKAIQALHHAKNGLDIVSKTPVCTYFGRPNWSKVFSSLASRHGGARIGVFYCGPPVLARELESLCNKITTKTTTRFVFHKENY